MLACRFSCEAYAKNVKTTKCSIKTLLRLYWMLLGMCLPTFDIYQVTVTLNCLKSHTNSWCPDFFQKMFCLMSGVKFTFSSVTSFLRDNLLGPKRKLYPGLIVDGVQTTKKYFFVKTVNGFQSLTIFTKKSILDIWLGYECTSYVS